MGAYLSEPMTEKSSNDDSNEFVLCGLSSMQGWRMSQEDDHNSLLDFDEGTSLFAVYDGHGGHEVAAYCARNLPKCIRETEAYKSGDYMEALKRAFLEFDASLVNADVITLLKEIAIERDSEIQCSDEEENVSNLHEEASMPIEQVLAKYQNDGNPALRKLQAAEGKLPPSPLLKGRRSSSGNSGVGASCSSSSDAPSGSNVGCSSASSSSSDVVSSSSANDISEPSSSNDKCGDDIPDTQTASPDVGSSVDVKGKDEKTALETAVSSGSGDGCAKQNGDVDSTEIRELNGDINHDEKEQEGGSSSKIDAVSSSSPTKSHPVKNGDVSSDSPVRIKGKGKAKDKSPRPDPEAKEEVVPEQKRTLKPRGSNSQLYRKLIKAHAIMVDEDSEDTEDEDDTTFEGGDVECDDDDDDSDDMLVSDDEDDDDDDDEDEDSTSEDEDEDEDGMDDGGMTITDEPGSDSGCTAVVALLRGKDLYVANAGDSRCVVCRNGKAIDMSLDHKPEDGPELERILSAGGKVTHDGRVNGGLNLSRAIGDHAYKQAKDLPDTEQQIIALPDVKTLRIDPEQDEFMVLACDGIWNFLSSQEVVDFVGPRLKEGKLKVSQICEELFDHCLAPNTLGDGTGCDNMTAVIVKFRPELANAPSTLTHDNVFDTPISNDAKDKEEKLEVDAEAEAKVSKEESEVTGDEVTTSISLKRAAPSDEPEEGTCPDSQHQDKRSKTKKSEDCEALAVEV